MLPTSLVDNIPFINVCFQPDQVQVVRWEGGRLEGMHDFDKDGRLDVATRSGYPYVALYTEKFQSNAGQITASLARNFRMPHALIHAYPKNRQQYVLGLNQLTTHQPSFSESVSLARGVLTGFKTALENNGGLVTRQHPQNEAAVQELSRLLVCGGREYHKLSFLDKGCGDMTVDVFMRANAPGVIETISLTGKWQGRDVRIEVTDTGFLQEFQRPIQKFLENPPPAPSKKGNVPAGYRVPA